MGGIVIEMNDAETEQIWNLMRNWVLITVGSIILMIITQQFIYYGSNFVPKIVFQILAVIQFSIMIIAIIYYIQLRKLKKQLLENTK